MTPTDPIAGIISHENITQEYKDKVMDLGLPIDCLWNITVKTGWGVRNDSLFFSFIWSSKRSKFWLFFSASFYRTFIGSLFNYLLSSVVFLLLIFCFYRSCYKTLNSIWQRKTIATTIFLTILETIRMIQKCE